MTPLVSWAATITGYEDFGDVAGVVLWRATQSTFHNSTVINVAADGTLGTAYAMDAGSNNTTSWKRFASNQGASCYTSPGTVLVYDKASSDDETPVDYTQNSEPDFGPLSFGGLWVQTLAANGSPFKLADSGSRATEFGNASYSGTTLFKFDKSFTIDRQGTFSFLGTVNLAVAQDAVFTINPSYPAQSIVVPAGTTLAPSGAGTITLNTAGLTVNGTLDLTASTLPTISGNVRFASGSSLVLPEGIATGEAISVGVCSGTLTADGVVSVKIGTADPINAALTISGGAITQIDEAIVEETFDSDYPTVVPAGYIYTFTTSAATVLSEVTVKGTLKTEGDFTITDLKVAASGALDVVSGNTTVGGAASKQLSGNITVRSGATLTNTLTDSLNYNGSMTVDIYGTLAMGSTRWSIPDGCTFKVHGGATVTGTGDGYGVLDFLAANDRGLDVYAASNDSSVTIEGAVRVRNNNTRIWVASGTTLVLQSGIVEKNQQPGSFKQTGPGTLEICATQTGLTGGTSTMHQGTLRLNNTTTAIPLAFNSSAALEIVATDAATTVPVNITSINGNGVTLTGEGKANGTITKTAAPSGNLATFLQSSAWEGTFVADWAGANGTRFDINSYGNANSTVRVTKLVGGYASDGSVNYFTVIPTVEVSGFMTLDNGYSGKVTTLTKLTGSGVFTNKTYSVDVTTLDNFTGTLATLIGTQYTGMQIGTINLSSAPAAGDKIVNITSDSNIGNIGNTKVSVNGVVDDTIALEVKSDGIYVVVPTVTITVPEVPNTTVTVANGGETIGTAAGNYEVAPGSVVTVTYAAASGYAISGTTEYTIDTSKNETTFEITDTTTAQYVAQIRTGATSYEYYTTLAAALDSENIAYGITLLADVTENNVTVDSVAIITGNHTINANVTIANGGQLQLMLATLNGMLTIQDGGTYVTLGGTLGNVVVQDGGIINLTTLSENAAPLAVSSLTLNGALTIVSSYGLAERGTTYKAISYVTENATIAEGASFNGKDEWTTSTVVDGDNTVVCLEITKVAVVDGVYYDTAQEAVEAAVASGAQAEFLVQPGTVTLGAGETLVVKGGYQPTVELDAGLTAPQYEVKSTYDSETFIYTYAVKSYVAQIGNTKYESLADAVDAATSGNTVTLLADVTLEERVEPNLGEETTLTINLGGYTLTREGTSGNGSVFDVKSGTVTIKNGTIDCTQDDAAIVADGVYAITARSGSAVTLTGLTVTVNSQAGACVYPFDGATVTITSGTYSNTTTDTYQYGRFHTAGLKGMAVNQANVATQLLVIRGGTFSQINPALGDDSWADGAGTFVAAGYEATESATGWTVTALPNYTVTFDVDGDTTAIAAQTVQKGSTATAPTAPTKDGYTFAGWTLGGSAYDFATPVTGNITLVASWTSSGIDPTDPTSTQEVTVDTSLTAEEQEAAAIEAATVTVPDGVSGVDAATYKTYFTYSATPTETAGTYDVAITGLADVVTETADGNALAALEAATAGGTLSDEVVVKPGLYYGTAAGDDVTKLKAPAGTLNTTGKLDLSGVTKPSEGTAFFIKIKVGATAFAAEE